MNIYLIVGLFTASFIAGWVTHTWYDGYKTKGEAIVAEQHAAAGETKIIHDTQTITKVVYLEKDDCIKKPVPADLLIQLH